MARETNGKRPATIRIAAAGDLHSQPSRRAQIEAAFDALDGRADLVLLAGDLTTVGETEEAAVLADAVKLVDAPVYAVVGNHDWHRGHSADVVEVLEGAGVHVLERSWETCALPGCEVGIVGGKGFVGGFGDARLPDFGEPLLRAVYDEVTRDVDALDAGLRAIADCPVRVVLLHYAPTVDTVVGEPPEIWTYLGTDRLAAPIAEHEPDLVVHGHAHAGSFDGAIGSVPVYNVSRPVTGRFFSIFELPVCGPPPEIHRVERPAVARPAGSSEAHAAMPIHPAKETILHPGSAPPDSPRTDEHLAGEG